MQQPLPQLQNVGYFTCPPVDQLKPLTISPNIEYIEILTAGKIRFDINGTEKIFGAGTVFWHKEGEQTICRTFADDPYQCHVLVFKVGSPIRPVPRISFWSPQEKSFSFFQECFNAFHSGQADLNLLSRYAYYTLCWRAAANTGFSGAVYPAPLLEIQKYIRKNLSGDLTPEKIAGAGGLSRPYLFALFRKHLNQTPGQYIQEQRIARAKILLTESCTRSIKEIATECGFNALEVFYRQFKKQTGLTPGEYRQKYLIPVLL